MNLTHDANANVLAFLFLALQQCAAEAPAQNQADTIVGHT